MFIGLTDRDSGMPVTLNTANIAVIRPGKDEGTDIRMAYDIVAGVHVQESYKYVMERINPQLREER